MNYYLLAPLAGVSLSSGLLFMDQSKETIYPDQVGSAQAAHMIREMANSSDSFESLMRESLTYKREKQSEHSNLENMNSGFNELEFMGKSEEELINAVVDEYLHLISKVNFQNFGSMEDIAVSIKNFEYSKRNIDSIMSSLEGTSERLTKSSIQYLTTKQIDYRHLLSGIARKAFSVSDQIVDNDLAFNAFSDQAWELLPYPIRVAGKERIGFNAFMRNLRLSLKSKEYQAEALNGISELERLVNQR